jgi:hypothetical protein
MPFNGILTRIGVPSDTPPHGTGGKRIIVTPAAASAALGSLRYMALNEDHQVTRRIGVITSAAVAGDAIVISGHINAAEAAARVKAQQSDLGFSFEAHLLASTPRTNPLLVNSLIFTGAAILPKAAAAFGATSIFCAGETMQRISHIRAAGIGSTMTVGDPAADQVVCVSTPLMRLFRRKGIIGPADGTRLSAAQLDAVLAGADTSQRFTIKRMITAAGLAPRGAIG